MSNKLFFVYSIPKQRMRAALSVLTCFVEAKNATEAMRKAEPLLGPVDEIYKKDWQKPKAVEAVTGTKLWI